jgi:Bacterial Ig-like domain (group 3)/FG-GAP-like repeat
MRRFPARNLCRRSLVCLLLSVPLAAQVNFLTTLHFPTGNVPRAAVGVDLNGDGKPDMVVCNNGDGTVGVLLGNGDGTFQPALAYSVGSQPFDVAVGDFNGDGKPDLAVTDSGASGTSKQVSVLLGNGDGTFQAAVNYPTSDASVALVLGDFNLDGKLDIAVTDFSGGVDILLGNGDGTFQAARTTATGQYAGFLTAADFNQDGKLDLAVINNNRSELTILLGNGDGTFTTGSSYPSPYQEGWFAIAPGDVNLDGKPDLVLTSFNVQGGAQQAMSVLVGNGDGTFAAPVNYGTAVQPNAAIIADFNGDGKPDVAVTDQVTNAVHILLGNGDGTFQNSIDYQIGLAPEGIAVADFNGDGYPDVATPNSGSNDASILLGNGNGTFRGARSFDLVYLLTSTPSIVLADFNGNGKLDAAIGANDILLAFGNGDGTFQPFTKLGAGGDAGTTGGIVAADFNHDGNLDLAATTLVNSGLDNNVVAVLLGNGNGTFQPEIDASSLILGPLYVAAGDFTGDGNLDLVINNSSIVTVALGNGTGNFSSHQVNSGIGSYASAPVPGDFNGDGKQDFVISGGTQLSVNLSNGDGTFQTSILSPTFSNVIDLVAADFNGDGFLDLAVVNEIVGGSVSVLLGNGDGTFQNPVNYPAGDNPDAITTADMNQDGIPDLVVGLRSGAVGVLLGNGDGTFQPVILFGSVYPSGTNGGGAVALAVGDVNGDGLPDVVLQQNFFAGLSFGSFTVLLNQTGKTLAKTSVAFSSALNPAAVGQMVPLTATVAPAGGSGMPTGTVTFMNGSTALATATLSGGTATWSTTGLGVGNDNITASYSGNSYFAASSSLPVMQVINATPFTATPSGSSSATVSPGQAASYSVSFTPGTAQSQTVLLSCSGAPATATCTISPNSIVLSGTVQGSATVEVQTASTGTASALPSTPAAHFGESSLPSSSSPQRWLGVGLGLMILVVACRETRRRAAFAGVLLAGLLLAGCGGSGGSSGPVGTQPGTYTVIVTAQSGNFTQHVNLTLTVQ